MITYRTSFFVDQNTPDSTALFFAARRKCFEYLETQMEFDKNYKVKLRVQVTDFQDTDTFFQVKTLIVTAQEIVV